MNMDIKLFHFAGGLKRIRSIVQIGKSPKLLGIEVRLHGTNFGSNYDKIIFSKFASTLL